VGVNETKAKRPAKGFIAEKKTTTKPKHTRRKNMHGKYSWPFTRPTPTTVATMAWVDETDLPKNEAVDQKKEAASSLRASREGDKGVTLNPSDFMTLYP